MSMHNGKDKSTEIRDLKIRDLVVTPPLALAPMVGLSHSAMRSLLVEEGGVGLLFTEMLAAKRLPHENEHHSPFLIRTENEQPLFYQLFVSDENMIEKAVYKLESLNAQGIDLNLGCPAPQLRKLGAGGYLAEDTPRVRKIVSVLRKNSLLPLSAKIRLGRKLDKTKLLEFCRMLEGEGIDLLTVHGRLHGEKFCRRPRWDWISKVKKNISIPVLANGGIFSVDDARTCLNQSGADGLMIGRGGVEKPWLFSDIAGEIYGYPTGNKARTKADIYFRFFALLEERFAVERRLGRLKQFTHYFAATFSFGHMLVAAVQTTKSMEEANERAALFFANNKQ